MKKTGLIFLLAAALMLFASFAAAQTVQPNAIDFSWEAFAGREVLVRIYDADWQASTVRLNLLMPESYDAQEIENLSAGDTLVSGGEQLQIESVERFADESNPQHPTVVATTAESGFLLVWRSLYGGYIREEDESGIRTYAVSEERDLPIPEHFILMDWVDGMTGDDREHPVLYGASDFLQLVASTREMERNDNSYVISFAIDNTWLLLDEYAQPVQARRVHVPWQ